MKRKTPPGVLASAQTARLTATSSLTPNSSVSYVTVSHQVRGVPSAFSWPVDMCAISVGVAVSCPHRHQAFDACRWLIDSLKEVVPIWKKELWADGTEEWVHPGLPPVG